MLNTPKKKNTKQSNYELQQKHHNGRSQSFVVWQQFYDLQHKQRDDEENEDDDIAIDDRLDMMEDQRLTGAGEEWYEDTEIDRGEYEQLVIEGGDIEIYQELDGKRPIKGSF